MPRALKVCSCTGGNCDAHEGSCPEIVPTGRCPACDQAAERRRGTAAQRGYTSRGHRTFRAAVLARDPLCVIPDCHRPSLHADHHPLSRRQLIAQGANPDDPKHGRGLCHQHHSSETAHEQPGGWNAR